jgi:uncharacterized membrane protein
MKELIVLGFASRELAEEAHARSAELDREGALQLEGAALAYRRHDGRVELVQPMRLAPVGAATGAASGAVLGMLVLAPVLFVVVSGGADRERAIEALQPLGPRVLRTNLSPDAEQRLLATFTEAAPQPGSTSQSPPASE